VKDSYNARRGRGQIEKGRRSDRRLVRANALRGSMQSKSNKPPTEALVLVLLTRETRWFYDKVLGRRLAHVRPDHKFAGNQRGRRPGRKDKQTENDGLYISMVPAVYFALFLFINGLLQKWEEI